MWGREKPTIHGIGIRIASNAASCANVPPYANMY